MKAKIITLPCRHLSNRTIAGKDNGLRYYAIELTETGTGERVYLKIPMGHYPLTFDGYDDHEAARAILETLLAGLAEVPAKEHVCSGSAGACPVCSP